MAVVDFVKSPLVEIVMDNGLSYDVDVELDERPEAVTLKRFASSLETLEIGHPFFNNNNDNDNNAFVQCPKLKTLNIHCISELDDLDTNLLVRMFPNLVNLSLGCLPLGEHAYIRREVVEGKEVDLSIARQRNRDARGGNHWKFLDVLSGELYLLHAPAIMCPVRHVRLKGLLEEDEDHLEMWATLLHDSGASAATVAINALTFWRSGAAFLVPLEHPLTHLDVTVHFECPMYKQDKDDMILNIVRLIHSAPLVFLNLHLRWRVSFSDDELDWVHHDYRNIGDYLTSLPPIAVARTLAESIPTLRYIRLTKELSFRKKDLPKKSTTFWRRDSGSTLQDGKVPFTLDEVPKHLQQTILLDERMLNLITTASSAA
ncbi:hypothetical protein K474DRAFT_1656677 [Panus rudis PR-1116 ss-1]|nr:hypothetical protein K474DRAFT_1656677 [Panus rudis PR-1116 ss-1]